MSFNESDLKRTDLLLDNKPRTEKKHYFGKFTCVCGYESEFYEDMEKHFEKEDKS